MNDKSHNYGEYIAFLQRHKEIIMQVVMLFHSPDSYRYREMVCDLTTYLWKINCEIPTNLDIYDEKAWVYTVVLRKAINLHRGESRRQNHLSYDVDLSNLVADEDGSHLINRLYRLIDRLDAEDRDLVLMYIDKVPTSQIAAHYGTTPVNIRRRLRRIRDTLRRLDKTVDDDSDDFESYNY